MSPKHFIDLDQIPEQELNAIIQQAITWKNAGLSSHNTQCAGLSLATLFEHASTRTRISFNLGAQQLGMYLVELDSDSMHYKKGKETLQDTARMLNGFVDALMYRTDEVAKFDALCEQLTIPLINGLSNYSHPCQIMADVMTVIERFGTIKGLKVLWVGDYNNVARSWCHAAAKFDFELRIASPEGYAMTDAECESLMATGADIHRFSDPIQAAKGVDVINTDVWVSMGDDKAETRINALQGYQVNTNLMQQAASEAIFLHCLPANRDQEVTSEVLDSAQSAAWQQAENRLHVQKAILAWCLNRL